jgi:hypothetical protein
VVDGKSVGSRAANPSRLRGRPIPLEGADHSMSWSIDLEDVDPPANRRIWFSLERR